MSDKYIIRNCPAISFTIGCLNEEVEVWDCQDCTDCVLKQIVELCKEIKLTYSKLDKPLTATQCTALFSRVMLANQILELLDIQEVE